MVFVRLVCLACGFLVPWFLGLLVSLFRVFFVCDFLVSWFLGLLDSLLLACWLLVSCLLFLGFEDYWFLGFKGLSYLAHITNIVHFMFFVDLVSKISKTN